jgi:hypothetical protein
MLDFEDGTGACTNGTAELHTTLKGTVRAQPRHGEAGESPTRDPLSSIGMPERAKPRRPHHAPRPAQRHHHVVELERRSHLLRRLGRVRRRRPLRPRRARRQHRLRGRRHDRRGRQPAANANPPGGYARRLRPGHQHHRRRLGRPVRRTSASPPRPRPARPSRRRDQLRLPLLRPRPPVPRCSPRSASTGPAAISACPASPCSACSDMRRVGLALDRRPPRSSPRLRLPQRRVSRGRSARPCPSPSYPRTTR